MKSRRSYAGIVGIAAAVWLSGCSLAVPGAGEDGEGDRLIGAFITADYLDLFDIDAYLNDHASDIFGKKEVTMTDTSGYEKKLYAEIDKSGGEDPADWRVSFDNIWGINFFSPFNTDDSGAVSWSQICSEGICDTKVNVDISDTGEELSLTGTLYILPGTEKEDIAYHANPVFQTADGRIYVVSGQGFCTGENTSEGERFSTTLSGETTLTENGMVKAEKSSVTVNYETMNRPVNIILYQMDAEHQILKKEIFKPGEFPEKIIPETEAEYILVEMEKETLSGEIRTTREVYDKSKGEDCALRTFFAMENGVVAGQDTEIIWNETEAEEG